MFELILCMQKHYWVNLYFSLVKKTVLSIFIGFLGVYNKNLKSILVARRWKSDISRFLIENDNGGPARNRGVLGGGSPRLRKSSKKSVKKYKKLAKSQKIGKIRKKKLTNNGQKRIENSKKTFQKSKIGSKTLKSVKSGINRKLLSFFSP